MPKNVMTEASPSSGQSSCEHVWKEVQREGQAGKKLLVCDKCGKTMEVNVENQIKEDKSGGKQLLLEG